MSLPRRVPLPGGRLLLFDETRLKSGQPRFRCRLAGSRTWGPAHSDMRTAAAAVSGLTLDEVWHAIKTEFMAQAQRRAALTGGRVYFTEGVQKLRSHDGPDASL